MSLSETDCACTKGQHTKGVLSYFPEVNMLLFWVLIMFVGHFNLKEGTSGLVPQICVHQSKCVDLAPQGVCPIWSVLAKFILLCLHGKRSKANIETES